MSDNNSKDKWYHFPKGQYPPNLLKAVAMAVHKNKLQPEELQYFWDNDWDFDKITLELYNRVKA